MKQPRILLMGCGGIGGIIAAYLFESGHNMLAVTHNDSITGAINAHGFQVREGQKTRSVAARAFTSIPADAGLFDFVLLAMQPPQVVEAVLAAMPYLAPTGAMVCFQNGLCEYHVEAIAGVEHTLGAIVAWGGTMTAPGVYDRTSDGGFAIGRLDGREDVRLESLRAVLEPVGPVDITRNLCGARWSKLAINCAISSLGTIGGDRLGALIRHRFVRRLALEVMTEAVVVAHQRGVRLEKVSGTIDLEWVALTPSDLSGPGSPSLMAKHALLLAVGARFRRLRSSMLAAIERGRKPAVDYLNGEIVQRASPLGIPVPLNQAIRKMVHEIARRERKPGVAALRELYDSTREAVAAATRAYAKLTEEEQSRVAW